MTQFKNKSDYKIAAKICEKLKLKNKDAILPLYDKYNASFVKFIYRRFYRYQRLIYTNKNHDVKSLVNNFWKELMNGNAICSYIGKTSLYNFLLFTLHKRLIDEIRKIKTYRTQLGYVMEPDQNLIPALLDITADK